MGLNECAIEELCPLLKKGEITPADIARDLKIAIERDGENELPLNAYVNFNDEAISKESGAFGRAFGRAFGGAFVGRESLLYGTPIGIKDVLNVRGTRTTCASRILQDYISPYDATAITYLRKNGGIPAGKLNMDEFAMGSSNENSAFGIVRNPHDRNKIPGGSSGGAASAVAGHLAIAALGSDTGGSIRQPASMCGVFGIKPTYGRVSRFGLVAYASSFDQVGSITKTVLDGAILLESISGYDRNDSTSADEEVPRYSSSVGESIKNIKIGIPEEYFGEGLEDEVRTRVEEGISMLREAGADIRRIHLTYTRYAVATYYIIATAEASSNLARFDGIRYGRRFLKTEDLIELYEVNRSRGFGLEVKRRILLGTFTLSSGYYDAYYLKAQKARTLICEDFNNALNEVDVIVTPVSPVPAWDIGEMMNDPLKMYLADIYTVPVNLAGLPAASVPCGKTPGGLPVGVQLISGHFREEDLFRTARVIEEGVK